MKDKKPSPTKMILRFVVQYAIVIFVVLMITNDNNYQVYGWVPSLSLSSPRTTTTTTTTARKTFVQSYCSNIRQLHHPQQQQSLFSTSSPTSEEETTAVVPKNDTTSSQKGQLPSADIPYDYDVPDDAVVHIKPLAMQRLRELRKQQQQQSASDADEYLLLRMGVRSGGCSGMSYVMDFTEASKVDNDDDVIDTYEQDKIKCIVDSKSMLYLYGLQLDYSPALIGGGFKFYNPNAEESCGCGSSFGI